MQKSKSQQSMESRAKHSDQVNLVVPKGERQLWTDYASARGLKLNEFIRLSVRHAMETDFPSPPPSSNS